MPLKSRFDANTNKKLLQATKCQISQSKHNITYCPTGEAFKSKLKINFMKHEKIKNKMFHAFVHLKLNKQSFSQRSHYYYDKINLKKKKNQHG